MAKENITENTGIDVGKLRCCFEGSFYPNGELEVERRKLQTNPDQIQAKKETDSERFSRELAKMMKEHDDFY